MEWYIYYLSGIATGIAIYHLWILFTDKLEEKQAVREM